jgi:hypothetical protein
MATAHEQPRSFESFKPHAEMGIGHAMPKTIHRYAKQLPGKCGLLTGN